MTHKFIVGQAVNLIATTLRPTATGQYAIVRLMPAPDHDPGNPCYRVKHIDEKHERVVYESEMTLSRQPESVFS